MSSALDIQGRNCIFQMKIDDIYLDVICAKTFSFNRVYELKETTTVQSGFDKEFRPRKKSYTISFNGVVQIVATDDKPTIKTLFDYGEGFLPVPYRIIYEDNTGNVMVVQGQAYVNSAIFNANPINLLDGTIEMTGNGPIERLDEIPEFINVTVSVTGEADIKSRFILYESDGTIAYDTSTLLALLPTGGWLVQGESVTMQVQKGQYAWGVNTKDAGSATNTFDLDITPAAHIDFGQSDFSQNSLPDVYDFLTDKTATFNIGAESPPPACVSPSIPGTPTLPDGQVTIPWATSFALAGTQPFNISNVTKPSWMTIELYTPSGGSTYVMFNGTPDAEGAGVPVSLDINNACGTVSFSDTIDVAAAPVTINTINWSYVDDAAVINLMRIYVNSVLVVEVTDDDSGSFTANAGDVIEAQVLASVFPSSTRHLVVFNNTDTITLFSGSGSSNQVFSFTAGSGKTYTITGQTD